MPLTDAEITALSNRIARDQDARTRQIVSEMMRAKTFANAGLYTSADILINDQGQILNAKSGGSGLVAIANRHTSLTINAGSLTRVNYTDIWDDIQNTITTGATTWHFTPPANGWYTILSICHPQLGGAPTEGETISMELWPNNGGGNIHPIGLWEAYFDFGYTPTRIPIFGFQTEYYTTSDAVHIRMSNGTANNLTISSKYYNRIIISTARLGA